MPNIQISEVDVPAESEENSSPTGKSPIVGTSSVKMDGLYVLCYLFAQYVKRTWFKIQRNYKESTLTPDGRAQ